MRAHEAEAHKGDFEAEAHTEPRSHGGNTFLELISGTTCAFDGILRVSVPPCEKTSRMK